MLIEKELLPRVLPLANCIQDDLGTSSITVSKAKSTMKPVSRQMPQYKKVLVLGEYIVAAGIRLGTERRG
jgi:hypothetical protein